MSADDRGRGGPLSPRLTRMVEFEVARIWADIPGALISQADLIQFGHVGLLEAQRRFDPTQGVLFETFARHRVRGAIFDGLRKMGLLRRRRLEALRRQDRAMQLMGEPRPSPAQPSAAEDAHALAGAIAHLALDHLLEGSLGVPPDDPEASAISKQTRDRVQTALNALSAPDQEVIEAIYDLKDEGASGAALARERGTTRAQISRRHLRVLERLRRQLE
ncbi:sigma-70 family RNA polymerase sigma factor [Myxococcota bacterium]|nr:sigma-70 family RNA polymerase sigma factor [Myxococcota bacterium]